MLDGGPGRARVVVVRGPEPVSGAQAAAAEASSPRAMAPSTMLPATEPRLMPHLHLSLQHGDDLILKRMKRRHLREDAIRFAQEARRLRPFPGPIRCQSPR